MKIITTIVGDAEHRQVDWPESFPIPREGEEVSLPWGSIFVRTVVWYPLGEPDEDLGEPFVYLVLGPRRPA